MNNLISVNEFVFEVLLRSNLYEYVNLYKFKTITNELSNLNKFFLDEETGIHLGEIISFMKDIVGGDNIINNIDIILNKIVYLLNRCFEIFSKSDYVLVRSIISSLHICMKNDKTRNGIVINLYNYSIRGLKEDEQGLLITLSGYTLPAINLFKNCIIMDK